MYHFNRTISWVAGTLLLTTCLLVWLLTRVGEEEVLAYRRLLKESDPLKEDKGQKIVSRQKRQGVQKVALIMQNSTRIAGELTCDSSELLYCIEGDRDDFIEEMQQVSGQLQEQLTIDSRPVQQLRTFSAAEATYQYRADQLIAGDALFSEFRFPGYQRAPSLHKQEGRIQGQAQEMVFKGLRRADPVIIANHLQTVLTPEAIQELL